MQYMVRHHGVPIGQVELAPREVLSAGVLIPNNAYNAIRETVRAGSATLLNVGFFRAASLIEDASPLDERVPPLRAAAELAIDLVDVNGQEVAATFVNLIQPPNDNRLVVLARIAHAYADIPATRRRVSQRDGGSSEADETAIDLPAS